MAILRGKFPTKLEGGTIHDLFYTLKKKKEFLPNIASITYSARTGSQMKRMDPEVEELGIGRKIRSLRKQLDFTLQQLSDKTGLSKPLLSQVENGHVVPPVSTLMRIAKALGVNISFFFQDEEEDVKVSVTRASERHEVGPRPHHPNDEVGYSYASLEIHKARKSMQPLMVTFGREEGDALRFYSHEGEECVYLIEGQVEFISDEGNWTLDVGDCLYFDSEIPHALRTVSDKPAKALIVLFPGRKL